MERKRRQKKDHIKYEKSAHIFLHVQKSMESNDDDTSDDDVLRAGGEAFLFVSARSF